jgi:hypothetical protein
MYRGGAAAGNPHLDFKEHNSKRQLVTVRNENNLYEETNW